MARPAQQIICHLVSAQGIHRSYMGQDRPVRAATEDDAEARLKIYIDDGVQDIHTMLGKRPQHKTSEKIVTDDSNQGDLQPQAGCATGENSRGGADGQLGVLDEGFGLPEAWLANR